MRLNEAGYMVTQVASGWAGAVKKETLNPKTKDEKHRNVTPKEKK